LNIERIQICIMMINFDQRLEWNAVCPENFLKILSEINNQKLG